jgi:LPS-assembly lipoprotein
MMRRIRFGSMVLAAVAAAMLSGCGYRPLYGTAEDNAGVTASMARIAIAEPKTRVGQIIRNDLISSMRAGQSGAEDRYSLTLTPELKTSGIIVKSQPDVTRRSVNLSVSYELVERQSGAVVHKGRTFSQASFDVVRQPFADTQAEADATNRAALEVSNDIRTRLAAFFSTQQ